LLKISDFKELKKLDLGYNKIPDITVLKKLNFDKLENLN